MLITVNEITIYYRRGVAATSAAICFDYSCVVGLTAPAALSLLTPASSVSSASAFTRSLQGDYQQFPAVFCSPELSEIWETPGQPVLLKDLP